MRALASFFALLFVSRHAFADGPLGPNGSRIQTSAYAVDLTAGPLLLGTRALGLGGAYVAIAEGVDGNTQNPAAPAVRAAWSQSHFDYDAGLTLLFPNSVSSSDFYNTGRGRTDLRSSEQSEFALLSAAGNFQIGYWGVGVALDLTRYELLRRPNAEEPDQEESVRAQISVLRTYLARAVDSGQLVGGLGLNVTALDVTTRDEIITRSGNIFTTRGVNLEGGLLWRPNHEPFRVGFALRAPVLTEVDSPGEQVITGDVVIGDPTSPEAIWLPRSVKRPWSGDLGVAVQLGARPLNPPWIDPVERFALVERWQRRRASARRAAIRRAARLGPDVRRATAEELRQEARRDAELVAAAERRLGERLRRRYAALSRRYLLLAASLHADGRVGNAVGIESFLQQRVDRSGERVTFSPRLGLETEMIPHWLVVRAGSYLEPSRFRGSDARVHGTAGFDLGLFEWSAFGLARDHTRWRFGAAADLSRDYFSWAVSFGAWH